ncbi:MAG TPA: hypothetical protein VF806_03155 [Anaerolineaceae bacterium]
MGQFLQEIFRICFFLTGVLLVAATLLSAVRTFVLPRSAQDRLSKIVFRSMRWIFNFRLRASRSYLDRDRIMAFYAPVSLMTLLPTWYMLVMFGFAMMYRALGEPTWYLAIRESVSSVTTLGFEPADGILRTGLAFTEAIIGLILVALLLGYLPAMYSAFSRRETAVTLLEVRAGDPPSAVVMIKRYYRIQGMDKLNDLWRTWENWFAEIEESHTSLSALVFFRSPQPGHSWVTASGAVLDAAGLILTVVDTPYDAQAALTIRAGYLALRHIADFFNFGYDPNPKPTDPISITRAEFDAACADLSSSGVPLVADRDKAWRAYSGWRVNYDRVLLALARITMAPTAPWSSDRPPLD